MRKALIGIILLIGIIAFLSGCNQIMTCEQYADYEEQAIATLDKQCNTAEDCGMGLSYMCRPFCVNKGVNMQEFLSSQPVKRPEFCELYECAQPELECACQDNACALVPSESKECETDADCTDYPCPIACYPYGNYCEEGMCNCECAPSVELCKTGDFFEELPTCACPSGYEMMKWHGSARICEEPEPCYEEPIPFFGCKKPEEEISLETDKEEYAQGEEVRLWINSWFYAYYIRGYTWESGVSPLKKVGGEWENLALECEGFTTCGSGENCEDYTERLAEGAPTCQERGGGGITFPWDQNHCTVKTPECEWEGTPLDYIPQCQEILQAEPGTYKFSLKLWPDKGCAGKSFEIESNEFTILPDVEPG